MILPGTKRGDMARNERGTGRMPRVDLRRLLPLAGATLLLVAGAFCAWQTWLIADEGSAAERTHDAQRETVKALSSARAAMKLIPTLVMAVP